MVLDILRKRRSVRKYQPKALEPEKIVALEEAALRAPSSRGLNPWEFVFVTDGELLERISKAKDHGSSFIKGAPLAVAVVADPSKCDVWTEDCSIAAILLQLTAESLGLGSCWVQIRLRTHDGLQSAEEYLKQLLGIPERYAVEAVLAIGYPAESKPGHPEQSLQREKLHSDRFGNR